MVNIDTCSKDTCKSGAAASVQQVCVGYCSAVSSSFREVGARKLQLDCLAIGHASVDEKRSVQIAGKDGDTSAYFSQKLVCGNVIESCPGHTRGQRTMAMLCRLPPELTRKELLEELGRAGFLCRCDCVYLPTDFRSGRHLGYAFVNLLTRDDAEQFRAYFQQPPQRSLPGARVAALLSPARAVPLFLAQRRRGRLAKSAPMLRPAAAAPRELGEEARNAAPGRPAPGALQPVPVPRSLQPAGTDHAAAPDQVSTTASGGACSPEKGTSDGGGSDGSGAELRERTTAMLCQLPEGLTRAALLAELERAGFSGRCDCVYLPTELASGRHYGYAFVNLTTREDAESFRETFTDHCRDVLPNARVLALLSPARAVPLFLAGRLRRRHLAPAGQRTGELWQPLG
mmetsp:Transcript_7383/g.20676  ORF Transcript_7383/g.20676 Transcript_7383/m.20676 type:complete len:400 (+) Transcript_7383:59-1258(+)